MRLMCYLKRQKANKKKTDGSLRSHPSNLFATIDSTVPISPIQAQKGVQVNVSYSKSNNAIQIRNYDFVHSSHYSSKKIIYGPRTWEYVDLT